MNHTYFSLVTVLACAVLFCGVATAQDSVVLKLWPGGAPGETGDIGPERELPPKEGQMKVTRITDVSDPTITLFRAPKPNGTAIVVCPGGGYNILAWDHEGLEVAKWLNSIGVTAVLLKYRVPRRDDDNPHAAPLQDAQRAIRLTRQNASQWGIDSDRLGIMGFSAGGNLTVMAGLHWDQRTYEKIDAADELSCRPNFMLPIYAAYLGSKDDPYKLNSNIMVTDQTPPAFMAVTLDDKERGAHAALFLVELKKAGVTGEVHVFSKGGHGYGLRPSENPVSGWPKLAEQWLRACGLLGE